MTLTIGIDVAGRSHVGRVRRRNEDALYLGRSLVAVADGLSGHIAGDVASGTAIEILQLHDRPVGPAGLAVAMGGAVRAVNEALRSKAAADPTLAGMGTTLVALMWSGSNAVLANLGDSRAYLHRGGELLLVTEDHTFKHLVADAAVVPQLPDRLSRFLDGRADGRSPDLTPWQLRPGDRFLLCSDGLSSYVPHDLIHAAVGSPDPPEDVINRLIQLALERGGPDNITVIVADVAEPHGA